MFNEIMTMICIPQLLASISTVLHRNGARTWHAPRKKRTFKSNYPHEYGKMLVLELEYEVEHFVLDSQV
jgi:hypothetical protein